MWQHIVNKEKQEISIQHPLENIKDKTIFLKYFLKDLNIEQNEFETISNHKYDNLFHIFFDNNYYNIFIEHVDQGGRHDWSKKVSINFSNSAIKKLLLDYQKLLIINFYCPLIKINEEYEIDWENRTYLIIRPNEIYHSEVYKNLFKKNEKVNPSSRWIKLDDILKLQNNKVEHKKFGDIEINFVNSYSNKKNSVKPEPNIYIVDHNNIKNFIRYIIKDEYLSSLEEEVQEYSKNLVIKDNRLNFNKYRKQFRELLINERGLKCEVIDCNINLRALMVASHIKPVWKIIKDKSLSEEEKIKQVKDINNGFLLCSNHDKLFDKFIMSFNEYGYIKMNTKVDEKIKSLCISRDKAMIKINNIKNVIEYLEFHNENWKESFIDS